MNIDQLLETEIDHARRVRARIIKQECGIACERNDVCLGCKIDHIIFAFETLAYTLDHNQTKEA